eukprot:296549_1
MAFIILVTFFLSSLYVLESSPTLPRADHDQVIGTYNKSIFLLGGANFPRAFVEYDTIRAVFIDHAESWASFDIDGGSQYYTQINHTLYFKDSQQNDLSIFDMKSKQFTRSFITNIPVNPGKNLCLTSTQNYLYLVGGLTVDLQIYDLKNHNWLSNVPPMLRVRRDHCCAVHPFNDVLYTIGGHLVNINFYGSIEAMHTVDITENAWYDIGVTISPALAYSQCTTHGNNIYIVGGYTGSLWSNTLYVLNVETNTCTLSHHTMLHRLSNAPSIVVESMLYVFGGESDGGAELNSWQWIALATEPPTHDPTPAPTYDPTSAPIPAPTHDPTLPPTPATLTPSVIPTKLPFTLYNEREVDDDTDHTTSSTDSKSKIPATNHELSWTNIVNDLEAPSSGNHDVAMHVTETKVKENSTKEKCSNMSTEPDNSIPNVGLTDGVNTVVTEGGEEQNCCISNDEFIVKGDDEIVETTGGDTDTKYI